MRIFGIYATLAPEPYRRCHLIQAALLGLGVNTEGIGSFLDRFVALAENTEAIDRWNTTLDSHEMDLLIKMLSDDGHLCEATLEAYFQLVSENSSVTEEELWDWAVPHLTSAEQNRRAVH